MLPFGDRKSVTQSGYTYRVKKQSRQELLYTRMNRMSSFGNKNINSAPRPKTPTYKRIRHPRTMHAPGTQAYLGRQAASPGWKHRKRLTRGCCADCEVCVYKYHYVLCTHKDTRTYDTHTESSWTVYICEMLQANYRICVCTRARATEGAQMLIRALTREVLRTTCLARSGLAQVRLAARFCTYTRALETPSQHVTSMKSMLKVQRRIFSFSAETKTHTVTKVHGR